MVLGAPPNRNVHVLPTAAGASEENFEDFRAVQFSYDVEDFEDAFGAAHTVVTLDLDVLRIYFAHAVFRDAPRNLSRTHGFFSSSPSPRAPLYDS